MEQLGDEPHQLHDCSFISFQLYNNKNHISTSADIDKWNAGRMLRDKQHVVVIPEKKWICEFAMWDFWTKGTGTYRIWLKSTGIVRVKVRTASEDFHDVPFDA